MFGIKTFFLKKWNRHRNLHIKDCGTENSVRVLTENFRSLEFEIRGKRNSVLIDEGCRAERLNMLILGDGNAVSIGKGCEIFGTEIWISGSECEFSLGTGCHVGSGFVKISLSGKKSAVRIGKNTKLIWGGHNLSAHEDGTSIEIGEGCLFSADVTLRTSDDHAILDAKSGARLNPAKSVSVGSGVWVAPNSVLLKGAEISDGSVIGTSSVVTKAFGEKGIVIAGNPAKVVGRGIRWIPEPIGD